MVKADVQVTEKPNGLLLDQIKTEDGYLFQVDGNIIFDNEFSYSSMAQIRRESTGISKLALLIEHFKKLPQNNIPVNTYMSLEFLGDQRSTILHSYQNQTYIERFGKLHISKEGSSTIKRQTYARELNISQPVVLFSGRINSIDSIQTGIKAKQLTSKFQEYSNSFNFNSNENIVSNFIQMLTSLNTRLSITFNDEEFIIDNTEIGDVFDSEYRDTIKSIQAELALNIARTRGSLQNKITELQTTLKSMDLNPHPNKTILNIKDDIQIMAKKLIVKSLRGNNGQLVLGRFRVVTKGHVKLVNKALREYDSVTICLIKGNELSSTMLNKLFGKNPKIHIIEHSNYKVSEIINLSRYNINSVIVGADRFRHMSSQINNDKACLGIRAAVLDRDKDDITQSDIIDDIMRGNSERFIKNTPKDIHSMLDDILLQYRDK